MNYKDAENLCNDYIKKYLSNTNYIFRWMSAVKTNGLCNYRDKLICLSSQFVAINDIEKVRRTIIHEIAHALCPTHGHDNVWKRKCRELGGDGRRTDRDSVRPESKYIGTCPNGHIVRYMRKPKHRKSCGICSNVFDERYLFTVTVNPKYNSHASHIIFAK